MNGIIEQYNLPEVNSSIIKVIGVGGGGSNAVNHMYKQGINDVSFVVCNTDDQALRRSVVPTKIQLGVSITHGLGAGNRPAVAREAAEESRTEIESMLSDGTKMVFITAGMGGGTGTGAAPVVASIAKNMNILTVGIVTIPFGFEGKSKILQALDGVAEMSRNVDALLVINNDRLSRIYPELELYNAFAKADNVLTEAARGIAEIITVDGHINVDFADVSTVMRNGGVAVMDTGFAEGDKRVTLAIEDALNSPLLNNNDIHKSKKILLNFYCSQTNPIYMREVEEINQFMSKMGEDIEVIWGVTFDDTLGDSVKVTLLATGSDMNIVPDEIRKNFKKPEEEAHIQQDPVEEPAAAEKVVKTWNTSTAVDPRERWMGSLYPDSTQVTAPKVSISLDMIDDDDEMLKQMENEPAYKRR